MKFILGVLLIIIARAVIILGSLELYLISVGDVRFNDGRELKIEYGVLFILLGTFLSYVSWKCFPKSENGWSQIPHQSIAMVAVIVAVISVPKIIGDYDLVSNYIRLLIAAIIAGSWWYRAKYKNT